MLSVSAKSFSKSNSTGGRASTFSLSSFFISPPVSFLSASINRAAPAFIIV
nr:MAG TPA: hypothetical protein [Caudoviricetes sp.]